MQALHGQTVDGKYLIGECLGEGGMGAVFRAEHVGIGRSVALKVVQPELLADDVAIERFKREARAAGALRHPNVVNVTDFGVTNLHGEVTAYLVMEYLQGQTLAGVLEERRTLPLRLVVDIVSQIADALATAHALGIVHRDLKPANIWLTPDTRGGFRVILLDFGIAKLRDDTILQSATAHASETAIEAVDRKPAINLADPSRGFASTSGDLFTPAGGPVTRVGHIVGTPAFMSPEQCSGDDVDHRSDIYSLGIVVYRLLSGDLPFVGPTAEFLRQHLTAEVPPFSSHARVPENIASVIHRALAKAPDDRFQSVKAFSAALQSHAFGTMESLRRAIALAAERLPELAPLSAWFVLPSVLAGALYVLLRAVPALWLAVLLASLATTSATAMASMAAVFADLKNRPFAAVSWREVARAVGRRDGGRFALLAGWFWTPLRLYARCLVRTRGNGVRNMLMFVDLFRRSGESVGPQRLARMAKALPLGAFGTMAGLQVLCTSGAPMVAGFAGYGLAAALNLNREVLAVVFGLTTFTVLLSLQTLVALVDVMLFDLAYDMTSE